MTHVVKNVLGVFVIDEDGHAMDYAPFSKDPLKIAAMLREAETGIIKEEEELTRKYNAKISTKAAVLENLLEKAGVTRKEYYSLLNEVSIHIATEKMMDALKEKDRTVIHGIEAIEDVDEVLNQLSERMREWCLVLDIKSDAPQSPDDHKKYAGTVLDADFDGTGLDEEDTAVMKGLANQVSSLYDYRERLLRYVESNMQKIAPNVYALTGAPVGAKLISIAGSLKRLAYMPASKIQVLGAEKAMFRHLKQKDPPPKHGAIFQHPSIKTAPWFQRGKIARALAAKIAIAARADYFSCKDVSKDLMERFEKRVENIRKDHPKKPAAMRIIPYRPEIKKKGKKGKGKKKRQRTGRGKRYV
jgi:nucleolar protein 56